MVLDYRCRRIRRYRDRGTFARSMLSGRPMATSDRVRRIRPEEFLGLRLRAHELMRDVPLYDVTVVDLPGGGDGRTLADIRALDSTARPSRAADALFSLRRVIGRALGWEA